MEILADGTLKEDDHVQDVIAAPLPPFSLPPTLY